MAERSHRMIEVPWFRCAGVAGPDTTREELLARGLTPAGADEVLAFVERLKARKHRPAEGRTTGTSDTSGADPVPPPAPLAPGPE